MVEVFKTNVRAKTEAKTLIRLLNKNFPTYKINIDLADCDKVLRVEGVQPEPFEIIGLVAKNGYLCEALP